MVRKFGVELVCRRLHYHRLSASRRPEEQQPLARLDVHLLHQVLVQERYLYRLEQHLCARPSRPATSSQRTPSLSGAFSGRLAPPLVVHAELVVVLKRSRLTEGFSFFIMVVRCFMRNVDHHAGLIASRAARLRGLGADVLYVRAGEPLGHRLPAFRSLCPRRRGSFFRCTLNIALRASASGSGMYITLSNLPGPHERRVELVGHVGGADRYDVLLARGIRPAPAAARDITRGATSSEV